MRYHIEVTDVDKEFIATCVVDGNTSILHHGAGSTPSIALMNLSRYMAKFDKDYVELLPTRTGFGFYDD